MAVVTEKIEIREYKIEDALEILCNPKEPHLALDENSRQWAEFYTENSYAKTVLYEDKVIGCGGIRRLWGDAGEAWILARKDWDPKTVSPRIAKRILEWAIKKGEFVRIQATPMCNWRPGWRFIEFCGFKREGILRRYNLFGYDCYMYARIEEK